MLHLNYQGGNLAPSIPVEIQRELKEKLTQPEGMISYKAIQRWLKETYQLEVPYSTVFGTVKYRLKAHLKVPRPYAEGYDQEAVDDFKKVKIYLSEIANNCLKKVFKDPLLDARRKPIWVKSHYSAADYG